MTVSKMAQSSTKTQHINMKFSSPGTAQALAIFLHYMAEVIEMAAAWLIDITSIPDGVDHLHGRVGY